MSLDAGGSGTGAIREARSRGESADSVRPVVRVEVRTASGVGAALKPGGGGMMVGVGERKVCRGLEGMGVPSSSRSVGGWRGTEGGSPGGAREGAREPDGVRLCGVEDTERVLKKGCCCCC